MSTVLFAVCRWSLECVRSDAIGPSVCVRQLLIFSLAPPPMEVHLDPWNHFERSAPLSYADNDMAPLGRSILVCPLSFVP